MTKNEINIDVLKRVSQIHAENFNVNPKTGNVTITNAKLTSKSAFSDYFEELIKSDKTLSTNPEQARSALTAVEINNKVQFLMNGLLQSPGYKNKAPQEQIETVGRIGASTISTALITNIAEMSNSIGVKDKMAAARTAVATIDTLGTSIKQFELLNTKINKGSVINKKQAQEIAAQSIKQIEQKAPELRKEAMETITKEEERTSKEGRQNRWIDKSKQERTNNNNNNNRILDQLNPEDRVIAEKAKKTIANAKEESAKESSQNPKTPFRGNGPDNSKTRS